MQERISIWLIPEHETAVLLDKLLSDLAKQLKRAVFRAHITIATGHAEKIDIEKIIATASSLTRLVLKPTGVLQTRDFKTAYAIRFEKTKALMLLHEAMSKCLNVKPSRDFDPHLSLTYGDIKETEELRNIVGEFRHPIVFDRLLLVSLFSKTQSQKDVKRWKEGREISLMRAAQTRKF